MEVWRRKFEGKGGVTIKDMKKNVNILVDRIMEDSEQVGYPYRNTRKIELE